MAVQAAREGVMACAIKALNRLKMGSLAGWRFRVPLANGEWRMRNGE
jgi:hypothetical protein